MTGGGTSAWSESRRVAGARKKAARVRDEQTLNQAIASIHGESWLEAMLGKLSTPSEHGMF